MTGAVRLMIIGTNVRLNKSNSVAYPGPRDPSYLKKKKRRGKKPQTK